MIQNAEGVMPSNISVMGKSIVSAWYRTSIAPIYGRLPAPSLAASVDINILCRLFQHQCHQRAVFQGLSRYRGAESVVLLFSTSTVLADRDIDG